MQLSTFLLIVNVFATFYLVGLIWVVQVVHYPLFVLVGEPKFSEYQKRHQSLITFVVGPPMLIEAVTSVLLSVYPPPGVSSWMIYAGIVLVVAIWLSTAFLQVPCHGKLVDGFDESVYRRLVRSNWARTIAWSVRGALATWMLVCVLSLAST